MKRNKALCIVTDKNYFPYTLVLIHGLREFLKDIDLYVVSHDISLEKPTREFLKAVRLSGSFKFWNNHEKWIQEYGIHQNLHVSTVAFAVADLPNLLPSYQQIFSIAVDISPGGDFSELLQTRMPFAISAVPDLGVTQMEMRGVIDDSYFNTGVVILNKALWLETRMSEQILTILSQRQPMKYQEQDLLNLVTRGHYGRLDRKWNQIPENCTLDLKGNIHFAGSEKPWSPNSRRSGSELWLQNAADLLGTVLKSSRYKLNNALYHKSLNTSSAILNHLIKVILSTPQLKMKYLDVTFVESIKVLEKIIEDQGNKS